MELRPGTLWTGERMLVSATSMTVCYTIGDRLYEWGTSQFVRDEYLNAMSVGASRAMPMVYLAQVEMALLQGIFVPWYLLLGLGVAKVGFFYKRNQREVDEVFRQTPTALRLLQELRQRHPKLFAQFTKTAVKEIVADLPAGVTGEDVAFFVGRVIKGAAGLPELALGSVVRLAATVGGIVAATHLPGIAAHGVAAAAKDSAAEIRTRLAEQGIAVSDVEARAMLQDLRSDREVVQKLRQLETVSRDLAPLLSRLQVALRSGG